MTDIGRQERDRILEESFSGRNLVYRCGSELGEFDPEVYSQNPFLEDKDFEVSDIP